MSGYCMECGMACGDRFHPWEFCVLYKAGVKKPEAWVKWAAENAGRSVAESEPRPVSHRRP